MILLDTDVLIWYLRGHRGASKVIAKNRNFHISVVTYIELVMGMRNKQELSMLRRSLRSWNAKLIYISEEISVKAMFYVEQYFLSNRVELADAFIAATAVMAGLPILTANDKHYRVIKEVRVRKFRP